MQVMKVIKNKVTVFVCSSGLCVRLQIDADVPDNACITGITALQKKYQQLTPPVMVCGDRWTAGAEQRICKFILCGPRQTKSRPESQTACPYRP